MRGWQTDDGWWFLYAPDPSFRCPIGYLDRDNPPEAVLTLCRDLAIDSRWLTRRLAHSGTRRRVEGRLTDRCQSCGHKLERLGFLGRIEQPVTEDEAGVGDRITRDIFGQVPTRVTKFVYLPTKREIREWAYEEYRTHRNALS